MTDITELALRLRLEVHRAVSNFNPQMNIKTRDLKALVEALESEKRICSTWRKTAEANSEKLEKAQETEKTLESRNRRLDGIITAAEQRIAELESRSVSLPCSLDFDCEMENGDYDIDEEPYLRGKVDGFNYALTKVRRLNGTAGIKWEAE